MKKGYIQSFARILAGLVIMAISAIHFYSAKEMAVFVPLPSGSLYFVYATACLLCLASLGIILNRNVATGLLLSAAVLAFTAFLVQLPIILRQEDLLRLIGLSNLVKLALAFVMISAAYALKRKL